MQQVANKEEALHHAVQRFFLFHRLHQLSPIEGAVTPNGRHFGRNFYVGWQETEINGCLLALDLEAEEPTWKDINGVADA